MAKCFKKTHYIGDMHYRGGHNVSIQYVEKEIPLTEP